MAINPGIWQSRLHIEAFFLKDYVKGLILVRTVNTGLDSISSYMDISNSLYRQNVLLREPPLTVVLFLMYNNNAPLEARLNYVVMA